MSTAGGRDRPRRLAVMVGIVVLVLAGALGVFISLQSRDPAPPEDVPRAIAIPALYATVGLLAIAGGLQRRPGMVVAAGLLLLLGAILSVATIPFAVPGVVLILLGSRLGEMPGRRRGEPLVAGAVVVLVVGAAVALLGMTGGRCWQATGSPADPTYIVTPCDVQAVSSAGQTLGSGSESGDQAFASGSDSGVLTTGGVLVEGVLLVGALVLTVITGRTSTTAGARSSIGPAPPP